MHTCSVNLRSVLLRKYIGRTDVCKTTGIKEHSTTSDVSARHYSQSGILNRLNNSYIFRIQRRKKNRGKTSIRQCTYILMTRQIKVLAEGTQAICTPQR